MEVVVIRQVWQQNFVKEISLISHISSSSGYASIDTEFPGTVFKATKPVSTMFPADHYHLMKKNVDATKIIQLGLTLSDSACRYTWEFNFRDFDQEQDLHDPDSIALLQRQGIDFARNKREGISATEFGHLFARLSGLVGPGSGNRAWITFHGLYDFGYLIKMMTGRPLPEDLEGFVILLRGFLGRHVYDLKPIAHGIGLRGGLEKVAKAAGVERSGGDGKCHQAGSDSLVTMQAFIRLVVMNRRLAARILVDYIYVLYGLTWLPSPVLPVVVVCRAPTPIAYNLSPCRNCFVHICNGINS